MLVEHGEGSDTGQWVLGAVMRNPFRGQEWQRVRSVDRERSGEIGELARDNDYLICSLGQWHYLGEEREYFIDRIETIRVGDALAVRVRLDWGDS